MSRLFFLVSLFSVNCLSGYSFLCSYRQVVALLVAIFAVAEAQFLFEDPRKIFELSIFYPKLI